MKMMFAAGLGLCCSLPELPHTIRKKTGAERQSQVHIYGNDYQPF